MPEPSLDNSLKPSTRRTKSIVEKLLKKDHAKYRAKRILSKNVSYQRKPLSKPQNGSMLRFFLLRQEQTNLTKQSVGASFMFSEGISML